jgi:hypothetical protein
MALATVLAKIKEAVNGSHRRPGPPQTDVRDAPLMAGPLNYTTSVPVNRSITEVQKILAKAGASSVQIEYVETQPIGVGFTLRTPHGRRSFLLPVDVPAMHTLLAADAAAGKIRRAYGTPEHAARVAWRVIKDWLEAQLALIDARMAALDQVMLPYLLVDEDRTLYAAYRDQERAALDTGGAPR